MVLPSLHYFCQILYVAKCGDILVVGIQISIFGGSISVPRADRQNEPDLDYSDPH
jgi:hypothetical protein